MTEVELSLAAMSIDEEDRAAEPLAILFEHFAATSSKEEQRDLLAEIYDCCSDELYGHALWRCGDASLAADVVQDVFLKIARARIRLGRVRRPRRYLLAMVHRAAADRYRRWRPTEPIDEPALVVPTSSSDGADRIDARRAACLLARLPATQREVIFLRFYAELTFGEIGAVTGVSTFTAASRYRLGLGRLRRWLGLGQRAKEDE